MREFVPFVCLAFVAFSGVFFGTTGRRGAAVSQPGSARPAAGSKGGARGEPSEAAAVAAEQPAVVRLLRDFYGLPQGTAKCRGEALCELYQDLERLKLENTAHFMTAVISDPIESSADHFDTLLDAMQRGFEAEQFVIDRQHLPWKEFLDGRGGQKVGEPVYRREPGVVLFRRTGSRFRAHAPEKTGPGTFPSEVVAVLLVGENPIFGVHQRALAEALATVADWPRQNSAESAQLGSDSVNAPPPLRLQILGPTYSGSALSLRQGLQSWRARQAGSTFVEILSGSAMAPANKKYLDLDLKQDGGGGALVANFHALSLPSNELQTVFFDDYLSAQLGADRGQIVLLTEGNTAYGASTRELPPSAPGAEPPGAQPPGAKPPGAQPPGAKPPGAQPPGAKPHEHPHDHPHKQPLEQPHDHSKEPIYISYPAQIGRARTAYEQQNLLALPAAAEGNRGGVEIRLEANPRAADLPPTFSPATAAHIERILLALLDAVNREGRHYVGLMGTSVEDRLFLAQLIYYRCPNVRLFCLDNNLLYTHPKYNRFLEGMLVASPYSLYTQHPRHADQDHNRRQTPLTAFSSDEAQATYLACRAVIGRLLDYDNSADLVDEYAASPEEPQEASPRALRPPVWVVQVGRNRMIPLARLPTGIGKDKDPQGNPLTDADSEKHYTLRLDNAWRNERAQALQTQMSALKLKPKIPAAATPAQPKAANTKPKKFGPHLHGPHPLYRASVAALGAFLLLAGVHQVWKFGTMIWSWFSQRQSAAVAENAAAVAATALDPIDQCAVDQYKAIRRVQWSWLVLLSLATYVLLAAPVYYGWRFDFDWKWYDVLVFVSGAIAIVGVPTALLVGIGNCCRRDYQALVKHRRARIATRSKFTPKPGYAAIWLESWWEVWAVPFVGIALPLVAALLFLIQIWSFEHVSQLFFLLEQLSTPADRISPLVPLWLAMLGFVFLFATRVLRSVRVLNETPHVKNRLMLILPWREAQSQSSHKAVPEVRDAQRAIEAIDHQAAIGEYQVSGILTAGIVILLCAAFISVRARLTTQPFWIEWSLRLALLGLTIAAVCLIGSGVECLRALESFWRHFSTREWSEAWGSVARSVRKSLKWRLFAYLPEGYEPHRRQEDKQTLCRWRSEIAVRLGAYRAAMNDVQRDQLDKIERWNADHSADTVVGLGLKLLRLLEPLTNGPWGGATVTTAHDVRKLLAPYVAELSLFVLSQLCRRLLGALVLVLMLMLCLESYAFQPTRFLIVLQLIFVAAAVGLAVWTYLAVNMNATLSAIAEENAGLTVDFKLLYESLLFLGVPILTVLSLHFPDFSDYFSSAANAVKGVKF